jgi:hypothetical protein
VYNNFKAGLKRIGQSKKEIEGPRQGSPSIAIVGNRPAVYIAGVDLAGLPLSNFSERLTTPAATLRPFCPSTLTG